MDRKIKHIIAENPFLTLEKIQSILLEHGSSRVPTHVEELLSLKQAEYVYSDIQKMMEKNDDSSNKGTVESGRVRGIAVEKSFQYLEDVLGRIKLTDNSWRINNLKPQEKLYFDLRCQYGLSVQNTMKLFKIGEQENAGVYDLSVAVRCFLPISKKGKNNNNIPFEQIKSKLSKMLQGKYSSPHKSSPFAPSPRELNVQELQNYIKDIIAKKYGQCSESVPHVHKRHVGLPKEDSIIHEEYLRKCSLGVSLPIHSFSGIQEIVKAAEYKYCLTSEFMLHLYRHIESDAVLKKYFIDNILEDFIKKNILSKRKDKENSYDRVLLSIYKNQSESQESSFDILTPKRFVLNWNDVKFFNGYFRIGPPRLGNINFATVDIKCPESICALNNLTNYFQQRLPAIHCVAKANKLTIEDEINLDQVIRYIKNASKQESLNPEEDGVKKKVSDQPVFFVRSLEESRRLGAKFDKERLKKFKSRYLNYLIDKQMGGYRVIPCNERVIHSSQLDNKTECAFIFTIAANSPRKVILAIENLNIDRATMLFSFERIHYERALRGIYEYLRSSEINKRSSLRRWESYGLGGIQIDYHAVNHRNSESYSWTEILKYRLRTM